MQAFKLWNFVCKLSILLGCRSCYLSMPSMSWEHGLISTLYGLIHRCVWSTQRINWIICKKHFVVHAAFLNLLSHFRRVGRRLHRNFEATFSLAYANYYTKQHYANLNYCIDAWKAIKSLLSVLLRSLIVQCNLVGWTYSKVIAVPSMPFCIGSYVQLYRLPKSLPMLFTFPAWHLERHAIYRVCKYEYNYVVHTLDLCHSGGRKGWAVQRDWAAEEADQRLVC